MPEYNRDFEERFEMVKSGKNSKTAPFFYGVRTTGIFCRPDCSSRQPRPENIVFFDNPEEAILAGYRSCKRCNPASGLLDVLKDLSVNVCRIIEESEEEPKLIDLAEATGYSVGYIQRIFKAKMGISPKQYAMQIKAERFRNELNRGSTVSSSIYTAGYGSSSRVYENLDKLLAMTPTQYKKSGKGIEFRMDIFPCSLGFVLIAFTEIGLAAVQLGDSKEELKSDFLHRFNKADIYDLDTKNSQSVKSILRKIENPDLDLEIPLDIHGTVFQKKVWSALRQIPSGERRTYSDIAEQIGQPDSVRAVANACGKNEIAVIIPCHRVIRKNGELAGYRWGSERKIRLLEREQ